MRKVLREMKAVVEEAIVSFLKIVNRNALLVMDLVFVWMMIVFIYEQVLTREVGSGLILVFFVLELCKEIYRRLRAKQNAIPKMETRFTQKKSNGDIVVEESKLQMAIVYLSLVEDHIHNTSK